MKKIFTLLYAISLNIFLVNLSFADTPKHIKQLTPKGWDILYFSEGDLNKDNQSDIAMMIEKQKPDIVVKNEDGRILNNNPRMLLIFFKDKNNYKQVAYNKTLPVAEVKNSCLEDPLVEVSDGVLIKNGTLTVDFSYFMSCGGWEWLRHYYTFRWQNNDFKLIGFDYHSLHRATGDETNKSYNFSTSEVKTTTVVDKQENNEGKTKTTWSKFTPPKLFSLKEINFEDFHNQFNY